MIFENIENISLSNTSWQDKVFLTFDIDWACNEVLDFLLDILNKADIKATLFCTQKTENLTKIKKNPKIKFGIHPNFNPLLEGNLQYGKNIDEIIQFYKDIVPEAISVRSHSLAQSSLIVQSYAKFGLKYDCSHFIPFNSKIELKPWLHWDEKIINVPHFWEDDVHCISRQENNVEIYLKSKGLKVFDFHPIHIFLNTENIDRYYKSKKFHNDFKKLSQYVNKSSYGTYNFLLDLIEAAG